MDGTVLVADDDRTIRTVLTQALTRAGCKVHATSSLMTLMRWVEEGKGDLVISDVIMPDGNGLETLPQINEKRPGLPVIVISAQNTIMTAIQATEADAYDYLPKPFDLPDLMKRAARALDQKRRATPAPKPSPEIEARRPAGGPAAGRAHAVDAGALPAGGAGDEHRAAGADHRRKRDRQEPHRPRHPRLFRPPHAALRRGRAERPGGDGRPLRRDRAGQGWLDPVRRGRRSGRGRAGQDRADARRHGRQRAARHGDLAEGPDGTDGGRRLPAGPVLPSRRRPSPCRPCANGSTTSRFWPTISSRAPSATG
jgi:CheY-like chemotaxis protein